VGLLLFGLPLFPGVIYLGIEWCALDFGVAGGDDYGCDDAGLVQEGQEVWESLFEGGMLFVAGRLSEFG
jgi:hypothetical protein